MEFLKGIIPREYQQKILKTCLKKNCLVVLPTGLGKTLIALTLTIERMKEFPGQRVVFLAPTKPLAEQHLASFKKHLPELFGDIQLFTGSIKPEQRKKIWQTADIIFSTPQCVANDLRKKLYDLKNVCLLVEDECVTKNTKIKLSDGQEISIEKLYHLFKKNKKIYAESLGKTGNIEPAKILAIHKIKTQKKIYEIETTSGKKIKATKDHLIFTKKENHTKWIESKNLKKNDKIATFIKPKKEKYLDKTIINEKDIIKKYNQSQQNFTILYKKATLLKEKKGFGARKISKEINLSENSIKNWVNSPYQIPIPLRNIEKLKEKKLLPLKYSSSQLKIISRLIGHICGDGWFTKVKKEPKIIGFSGEIKDLKRIQKDLDILAIHYTKIQSKKTKSLINTTLGKKLFIKGSSNSFSVTDACLVKLIDALNTPRGNKTTFPFLMPKWLMDAPKFIKKEFLSSLMGSEGDSPRIKKNTCSPYSIRFTFHKLETLKENGLKYVYQIKKLFEDLNVKSTISLREGNIRKNKEKTLKIQLTISNSNKNITTFLENIGYSYNSKKAKETNKILDYLKFKEEKLKERELWHQKIIELKNKGSNTHKAIQILAKKIKIKPSQLWKLGYGKPTHASWLIENYEKWKKQNTKSFRVKWEKIKKIRESKKEKYVYDLTIKENHNYIGNGFIVHNCHRCVKNYDYNYISQEYKNQSVDTRILGLTASPGSNLSKIKEICQNLSIEAVELRTRESEDVKKYLQKLEFEKITVDFPKEFQEIKHMLLKLFNGYVEELRRRKVLFGPSTKIGLIELQKKISRSLSMGNKNFNYMLGASACAQAIKLQHALELLETQTLSSFNNYLKNLLNQAAKKQSKGVVKLVATPEFNFIFMNTNELLAKNTEHPKLAKLLEIIKQEKSKNQKIKLIVFTQFRDTATIISSNLNKISGINAEVFVGQAKRTTGTGKETKTTGLNQKEQKKIIEDFSEGKTNVLCATSLHPEEYIVLKQEKTINVKKIGEFVNSFLKDRENSKKINGWEALSTDGKKTFFKPITHIHKHKSKDNLIEIKLSSGFDCQITKDHKLFSFNDKKNFIPSIPKKNKFTALTYKCPNIENKIKIDVLEKINKNVSQKENFFGNLEGLTQAKIRLLKTNIKILSLLKKKNLSISEISRLSRKNYSTTMACLKRLGEKEFIIQKRMNKNYKKISKITSRGAKYLKFLQWFFKEVKYHKRKYRFKISKKNNKYFDEFFTQHFNVNYGKINCKRILENNKYLARFLGFYVSEGHARKTKKTSGIFLAARKKQIQKLMIESIEKGLNIKVRTNWKGISIDAQISYYLIKDVFKAGIGAYNKEVPEIIFTSPSINKWEFLKAYFLGDGHLAKDRIVLTTVSRKLVVGLMFLLRSLGITKISLHKQKHIYKINIFESLPFAKIKDKNEKHRKKAYFTLIPKALINKEYYKKIKNYFNTKNYKSPRKIGKWNNEICFDYIKEIKKIKAPEFVYDITVKDTENFIGGTGLFCLHNCIAEEGLDIPEVNAVIFYEPVPSAIRAIQRAGRTARLMKGKLIILITKGTRDEAFYYASRSREKKMHSAIDQIRDDLSKGKSLDTPKKQKSIIDYFKK